jgi:hypothetical protein
MEIGEENLRWGEAPTNSQSPFFWVYGILAHEMYDV